MKNLFPKQKPNYTFVEMSALQQFHPAVQKYFRENLGDPSAIQEKAWPVLQNHRHALISAPTGSGKTLAAFLSILNDLIKTSLEQNLPQESLILYISPLKALSNDIEKNLRIPLNGIVSLLEQEGLPTPDIGIMVRSGDTSPSQRQKMLKLRPHIIVTTPESLYVLLTSDSGRRLLSTIRTVIVDEIHAIAESRRGTHLSLSLERLEHLCGRKLQRIGISATVKPLERIATFLCPQDSQNVHILNEGHTRKTDLRLLLPDSPLDAIMTQEAWAEVYKKLLVEIEQRNTCLIFVNNRRLCERLARHLSELIGQEKVGAHHGSLSHAQRLRAENALKDGQLKVMVATASLELGIDIGSIDLVVQISSPRSIHTFLQRIGRSEHRKDGVSRAILVPLTRDDLMECLGLLSAMKAGHLEELDVPIGAFDVLAQQIVAEVSCADTTVDGLYSWITKADPYQNLTKDKLKEILSMLNDGYSMRFGRRARYIFFDSANDTIQSRRGSRLSAITNGGAIPENFEYEVILEEESVFLGTVHEDFAIESMAGDVFQLGNQFWRIKKVGTGKMYVSAAPNSTPTMPFWIAEAPGRTDELSAEISALRAKMEKELNDRESFIAKFSNSLGAPEDGIAQTYEYLNETRNVLGAVPTQDKLIMERFFDEVGDCHIVIHSPYGTRVNRAWGLALRKRFCRKFNFELQAAANDDAILFSLSHTHSFALQEVFSYIKKSIARNLLIQAVLDSPMFEIRWRWNASRSLAILRSYGGKRTPPQFQKSQAQDLVALVFPDQIACAENLSGERQIPDHPLVDQTINDCLHEAMDIDGWENLLERIETGNVEMLSVDTPSPSVHAHEIINARPYAFLDDAPLEERRSRAVRTDMRSIPQDDVLPSQEIIDRVKKDSVLAPRDAAELYYILSSFSILSREETLTFADPLLLQELIEGGRIAVISLQHHESNTSKSSTSESIATESIENELNENESNSREFFATADRLESLQVLFPNAFAHRQQPNSYSIEKDPAQVLNGILLRHLELCGPVTIPELQERFPLSRSLLEQALHKYENDGSMFRIPQKPTAEMVWCERSFWQRMRHQSRMFVQKSITYSPEAFLFFLEQWQHVTPSTQMMGSSAVESVAEQLQGFSMPIESWIEVFRARITDFRPEMLDQIFLSGKFIWWRPARDGEKARRTITRNVPIMILSRELLPLLLKPQQDGLSHYAQEVYDYLKSYGASFLPEIQGSVKLFEEQLQFGIRELVARGLVTSDSLSTLQNLFIKRKRMRPGMRRGVHFPLGRWSLLKELPPIDDDKADMMIARLFLKRYGVIFRYVAQKEFLNRPWPSLVRTLRRLEMQGELRGGRFIKTMWGEQFALPEAIGLLDRISKDFGPSGNRTETDLSSNDPIHFVKQLFGTVSGSSHESWNANDASNS